MANYITLACPECSNRNYRTSKKVKQTERLELKKFCNTCRTHTLHKEQKK